MWSWDLQETAIRGASAHRLHITDNFTLIDEQQRGLGIRLEFANQRVVDLGGQQVFQHIHGRCEQYTLVGLASLPTKDFGQESFANTRIADQHDIGTLPQDGGGRDTCG
jgi:hypothetical protein